MLTLTVTTSAGKIEYRLDLPVNDKIELHYDQCSYCECETVRRETVYVNNRDEHRFCRGSHRSSFNQKQLGVLTARCSSPS